LTTGFFIEYAQSVVLDGFSTRAVIQSLLSSSRALTRHSNIIHVQTLAANEEARTIARKYVWTHKSIRPNGTSLPLQCGTCKSIGSWKCSLGNVTGDIQVSCNGQINGQACTNVWIAPKMLGTKIDNSKTGIWTEETI
jgi:hypothetical protein